MLPQVRSQAGREAQMDWMLNDGRGEQGIEDLDQSITTAAEGGIHGLTKGAQALQSKCVHAGSMPECAFRVHSSSPPPCCWLNGKLSHPGQEYGRLAGVAGAIFPTVSPFWSSAPSWEDAGSISCV
jgi:hypothetical protein